MVATTVVTLGTGSSGVATVVTVVAPGPSTPSAAYQVNFSLVSHTDRVGATGNSPGGGSRSQTMHMVPIRALNLGHNGIKVHRDWMIHGSLATIRSRVYELHEMYPGG